MSIEEDREFLLQQREPGRPGYIAGVDKNLTALEKRKAEREERERRDKKRNT